jgi:hypothetical protein
MGSCSGHPLYSPKANAAAVRQPLSDKVNTQLYCTGYQIFT